ncbi:MAG: hypothetical protein SFU98_11330 [Leptospiraceae bacterium]|nr:hypothetical protein [Leptospiraceae bacterium]
MIKIRKIIFKNNIDYSMKLTITKEKFIFLLLFIKLFLIIQFISCELKPKEPKISPNQKENLENPTKKNIFYLSEYKNLFEIRELTSFFNISASSTLNGSKSIYSVQNTKEENEYSWCEGIKGDGVGEFIEYKFKEELLSSNEIKGERQYKMKIAGEDSFEFSKNYYLRKSENDTFRINRFYIYNGYGEVKNFELNNRVKQLVLESDLGEKETVEIKDVIYLQEIQLSKPLRFKSRIRFIIDQVYNGSKFSDTCIHKLKLDDSLQYYSSYRFKIEGREEIWVNHPSTRNKDCLKFNTTDFPKNFKEGCLLNCDPQNGPDYSILFSKDHKVKTNYEGNSEGASPQWEFIGAWEKAENHILVKARVTRFPYSGCYYTMSENGERCVAKFREWFSKEYKDIDKVNLEMKISLKNKNAIVSKEFTGKDSSGLNKFYLKEEEKNYGCIKGIYE